MNTRNSASTRACVWILLASLYVIVAAASFSGYFAKWAFRDGEVRGSFVGVLEGTSDRPFVYRQLIPMLSKGISALVPAAARAAAVRSWTEFRPIGGTFSRATDADAGPHVFEYHVAYYLCFSLWLLALLVLARICMDVTGNFAASVAAPLVFAAIFPLLMTRGGYFYDPVEMFFLAVSAALAIRGRIYYLLPLTLVATLNKESFLFWLPCLWPLLPASTPRVKRLVVLGLSAGISGATYLYVKSRYVGNVGGPVEFHLMENLAFYLTPGSYFKGEISYGLPLPRGVSLLNLVALAALLRVGWGMLPGNWKTHALVALSINIPLYLAFCWFDELRNLSLLFVLFTVLVAGAIGGLAGAGGRVKAV